MPFLGNEKEPLYSHLEKTLNGDKFKDLNLAQKTEFMQNWVGFTDASIQSDLIIHCLSNPNRDNKLLKATDNAAVEFINNNFNKLEPDKQSEFLTVCKEHGRECSHKFRERTKKLKGQGINLNF